MEHLAFLSWIFERQEDRNITINNIVMMLTTHQDGIQQFPRLYQETIKDNELELALYDAICFNLRQRTFVDDDLAMFFSFLSLIFKADTSFVHAHPNIGHEHLVRCVALACQRQSCCGEGDPSIMASVLDCSITVIM